MALKFQNRIASSGSKLSCVVDFARNMHTTVAKRKSSIRKAILAGSCFCSV